MLQRRHIEDDFICSEEACSTLGRRVTALGRGRHIYVQENRFRGGESCRKKRVTLKQGNGHE